MISKLVDGPLRPLNANRGGLLYAVPRLFSTIASHISDHIASHIAPRHRCHPDCPAALKRTDAAFPHAFPQLVFCATVQRLVPEDSDPSARDEITLTVYRPVGLDVVFDRLRANCASSSVSFFGVSFNHQQIEHASERWRAQDIHTVVIKEGACLIPRLNGRDIEVQRDAIVSSHVNDGSQSCRLHVAGEHPDPGVGRVFELMMDCAMWGSESSGDGLGKACEITCREAALEILAACVRPRVYGHLNKRMLIPDC
jgi:hypothetical protein